MRSNFLLGKLHVTDAARIKLRRTPLDLIARHAVNDHGLATVRELRANQRALMAVGKIISRFVVNPLAPSEGTVEVVTDDAWENTTVKLMDE